MCHLQHYIFHIFSVHIICSTKKLISIFPRLLQISAVHFVQTVHFLLSPVFILFFFFLSKLDYNSFSYISLICFGVLFRIIISVCIRPFSLLLDYYLSWFITSLCFGFHSTVMDSSLVLQQPLHRVSVDRNFPFTLSKTSTKTHLMSLCMNQARGVAAYVTHPVT